MTAPFGPKHTPEAPSPLDLTAAERAFMEREQRRQQQSRETYERRQRAGGEYRPTLRATPIVPKVTR
jgi:hypothetical protein